MKQYTDAVSLIMDRGRFHPDRTGTGTWKLFGLQMRFDLADGFPMVTEKFVPFKSMVTELIWLLSGSTNVKWLQEHGCTIWDEWALPDTKTVEKTPEELNRELGARMDPPREFGLEPKTGDELAGVFTDTMEAFVESIKTKATEVGISLTKEIQVADGGELGPVYGKQWRNWATGQQRPLALVERVKIYNERAAEVGRRSLEESIQISDGDGGYYTEFSNLPPNGREEKALHDHLSMSGIPETTERLVDQMKELIENLKSKPYSRRHLVSAWNVADLPDESVSPQENAANGRAALASCHAFFQFNVERLLPHEIVKMYQGTVHDAPLRLVNWYSDNWEEEVKKLGLMTQRLSCQLYQRSADMFLGVPFNIASYSLLTMMVAQVVNMVPGEFIWTGGDCHVYSNHKEQVERMLANPARVLPQLIINPEVKDLFAFTLEDFELVGYHHGGKISAPVAV